MDAKLWYDAGCELGEGPLWHAARRSFFWVDIERKTLFEKEWSGGEVRQHRFDRRVSVAVPGKENELILGMQGGIARYHLVTETITWITPLGIEWQTIRCNDARADHEGRLWIGTMPMQGHVGNGHLYCIEAGGDFTVQQQDVLISNGMAWSADNRFFYYTDSSTREIWRYDFHDGRITNRHTVITIPAHLGLPDGMAIDMRGMLWIALYGGSGVGCWNPASGEMTGFIALPVPHVTSCAFAGEQLDTLLITTAAGRGGGGIYMAKPGVQGVPPFNCTL
ncbi:SMP-30/gluconolactonase/LRE family protein [Chitinophaga lutea]|uniref:SMP-30/gluconolactonase/LRE family protein n=1 Tax=Chitinophaga lutea TaxID=2488634 RepID=A0A3N4PYX8_9BACT|nr:SMP-30/gluconolactonase/LRE family protein [Chitinophaga lutea]RPE09277.1 SMP-30/gluconolactonase/LRE family protein [Chitinophaga lutea]